MKLLRILNRIGRVIWCPIRVNAIFFISMYILGVVCSWLTIPQTPAGKLYQNLYLELFLDLYVLCAILAAMPHRIRRWIRLLLAVVLYVTAIADVYCFGKYGSTLTPTMLMLVGETDSREAGEFLRSCLSWETLTKGVGWILLIALLHTIVGNMRLWKGKVPGIVGYLVLALLVWSGVESAKNKEGLWCLMTLKTMGEVENEITRHHRAEQYLPIYRLVFSMRANHLAAQQIEQLVKAADKAVVDSCSFRSPNIVFIIGESYNKHHSQMYGYYMPTTPRQLVRERSGQLVKFTDVVSMWNLTSFVFKHVFSMQVIGQKGEWCDYPLFPEIFKKAGYEVTFLTNQFLPKAKDAVYDFSGGFFLNNLQLSQAMFDHRNTTMHPWDDGLLRDWDILSDSFRSDTAGPEDSWNPACSPQLVIFHLLGQHMNYRSRYPKTRQHFTAADYEEYRPKMLPHRKKLLVEYDNAVLYNDSIVDQICRRFEDKEAIVIYMPDHGEECYEPGRLIICRNHTDDIDYDLARYEYEVPFWIWCSKKYMMKHPDIYQEIVAARNRRMMTDAMPHLLLYLAGIAAPDYHAEYNILSHDYDELRPRLLKAATDYDQLKPNGK